MNNTYQIATGTVTVTPTGLIHRATNAYSGKIAAKELTQKSKKK